jgi:hypothetical protein
MAGLPNSTYTEIATTTLAHYQQELADNISNHNALLSKLKSKGNAEPVGGGTEILENLMYDTNSTVKWYSGLETLDITANETLTSAQFAWKELNANVVISGLDKARNSGTRESVFNLVKSRIRVCEISLQNEVGNAIFFSNTENAGKSIGGLQFLIADLPTSGSIGNIDCGAQPWWANQYYDFSTEGVAASEVTIQNAMNRTYIAATRGRDKPDMIVGGTTYFRYYLSSLQANQRFMKDSDAGAGFANLTFWGGMANVFFDPAEQSGTRMYFLCTDYIHFRPHSDYNFVTLDDKVSTNQDATIIPMYWKGNMTLSNRARQGIVCA